tara:strand:+ start:6443 stop:6703 length:261 start_codon:yes stop_codon:yes gene_type:complete
MFTTEETGPWTAKAIEALGDKLDGYQLEAKPVAMGITVKVTDKRSGKAIWRTMTKSQIDDHVSRRLNTVELVGKVSIAELKDGLGI